MKFAKRSTSFKRIFDKNYNIDIFNYLVNSLNSKGLKLRSFRIIKLFFFKLKKNYKIKNINLFFFSIISKYLPVLSFLSKKITGIVYLLPYYINKKRAVLLFLKWFVKSVFQRKEFNFIDKLFNEFNDMVLGLGKTISKLKEYYELALKNKPFLKFLYKNKKGSKLLLKKYKYKLKFKYR